MGSPADRLPNRFPVGTRYVVVGRGGDEGRFRVHSRYIEYPDGRQVALPVDLADWTRARSRRRPAAARK
jgi:hypothetical protein